MSRVAKASISLPNNVGLTVTKELMTVKGPKGELTQTYNKLVDISTDGSNVVTFKPASKDPKGWAHAGTARALLNNMVKGVTEGFTITLELVGVGYRAQSSGKTLNLSLGFSHPVEFKLPEGVTAETPNNTTINLRAIDKQLLGQVAAEIRAFRKPEPYKGKGIKYAGEYIARKEAKKK
ncbi:50S ribosomal protein L6 [Legionella gresilensis]|uniref:50S ribosomal protein L6 n=1 Tax=Legionella gresilensis TaxID=91823 RepID=UPI0010417472|nr:50S ribosomal protein L6 [Legionella gresilensis]